MTKRKIWVIVIGSALTAALTTASGLIPELRGVLTAASGLITALVGYLVGRGE